jgi:hypothetical protein
MKDRCRAFAACWLLALASCASDGGQRGTGITVAAGNVASVQADVATGVAGIDVSVEGTDLQTTTEASGAFELRGRFAGDTALRFTRTSDGVSARLAVNAPAGGRIDARDVVLNAGTGGAQARTIDVSFEGRVETLACDAARVTLVSVHRAPDDLDDYVVTLDGSSLHDANGVPLACADLRVDDRVDVAGTFLADDTIGDADLTRR